MDGRLTSDVVLSRILDDQCRTCTADKVKLLLA